MPCAGCWSLYSYFLVLSKTYIAMDNEEITSWLKKLENKFGYLGKSPNVSELFFREKSHSAYIERSFSGHLLLLNSFIEFYAESVSLAGSISLLGSPQESSPIDYPLILMHFKTHLHTFRACEILFSQGYPMNAYSELRDLRDQAIYMSGILHGITSCSKLHGLPESAIDITIEDIAHKVRTASIDEENKVKGFILNDKDKISVNTINELKMWNLLFNRETHGSKLTAGGFLLDIYRDGKPFSVFPEAKITALSMYMNRATEVGWMHLKVLPVLQRKPNSFPQDWADKWKVLDECFKPAMLALYEEHGKKIALAINELIDIKFSFSPDNHYKIAE